VEGREPVVHRLRERRSLVRADAERIAVEEPRLHAVGGLIQSLEEELDLLLSFDSDPGRGGALSRALWLQHERLREHDDFRKQAARLVAEAFEIGAGSSSLEPVQRRFQSAGRRAATRRCRGRSW